MASSISMLFEAKQISLMSVTPQIVGTGGSLTNGVAYDLADLGVFDRFTFNGNKNLFEYSPANAPIESYQRGKVSFTATISQFDKPGKASILLDLYAQYDYVRVAGQAIDPLSGTNGKVFVIIAAIDNVDTGYVEQKNATSLILRPCGILPQFVGTPTI